MIARLWFMVKSAAHDRFCPCGFDGDEWSEWVLADGVAPVVTEHRRLANGPQAESQG